LSRSVYGRARAPWRAATSALYSRTSCADAYADGHRATRLFTLSRTRDSYGVADIFFTHVGVTRETRPAKKSGVT
jgi:hypothetical protein